MASTPEALVAVVGLALAVVFFVTVVLMARELRTGIFVWFFRLLQITAAIALVGRSMALLQVNGIITPPFRSDLVSAIAFLSVLTASFVSLYHAWRHTTLVTPIKKVVA